MKIFKYFIFAFFIYLFVSINYSFANSSNNNLNREIVLENLLNELPSNNVRNLVLFELINSLKKDDEYRLFISTNIDKKFIPLLLWERNLTINWWNLNNINVGWVYEVRFKKNSWLWRKIWRNIELWILPNDFPLIEVIAPFPVKLNSSDYLLWEEIDRLWWNNIVWANNHQELLNNSKRVRVWVMDTWIDVNHPDLKSNIWINKWETLWNGRDDDKNWYIDDYYWYNFINNNSDITDRHWHWTHVAWTIWAAVNWFGVYWINSNVDLVALKVLWDDWYWSSYAVYDAIIYAVNNDIPVLNMSFWANADPKNNIICTWISYALNNWVISVVAAWNSNIDVSRTVPAWCPDAITVAAVDQNLNKASFSNFWNLVDISAPWVYIYSTYLNNRYAYMNWTSMAAPIVSWVVSAIISLTNSDDISRTKEILLNNISDVNSNNIWWMVNLDKIISYLDLDWNDKDEDIIDNIPPVINYTLNELSINKYLLYLTYSDLDWYVENLKIYLNWNLFYSWLEREHIFEIYSDTLVELYVYDNDWDFSSLKFSLKYNNSNDDWSQDDWWNGGWNNNWRWNSWKEKDWWNSGWNNNWGWNSWKEKSWWNGAWNNNWRWNSWK